MFRRGMELGLAAGQGRAVINPDQDLPTPARKLVVAPPLDMLGVAELRAYIADLEAEIVRVKATISVKEAHKTAAAAFFRSPGGGGGNAGN